MIIIITTLAPTPRGVGQNSPIMTEGVQWSWNVIRLLGGSKWESVKGVEWNGMEWSIIRTRECKKSQHPNVWGLTLSPMYKIEVNTADIVGTHCSLCFQSVKDT